MKTLLTVAMGWMLVALWPTWAIADPPRLALLVGVSKYKQGPDPWRELHTETDIAQLKEVLIRHHGFQESSVRVLHNEQATGEGIRRAFHEHLIDKATPGAVVVFHFSGHGQQILDDNGDELDGLDESLVPHDTSSQRAAIAARTNIRDDEIGLWLHALRQKMTTGGKLRGSINVFLDSCYSGTATRGQLRERGRAWDPELDGPQPKGLATSSNKGAVGLLPLEQVAAGGFVLLSAARSHQTAKEVDGRGAFSLALIHALARVGSDATMRTVFDRVTNEVAGLALFQDPVFEGPIDTLLFSGIPVAPSPYLPVIADPLQPSRLRLPIGEVHGATVGSLFALHAAGSAPFSEKSRLGDAVVESVNSFFSELRLRQKLNGRQLAAARAVEVEHAHGGRKLRVHLLGLESLPTLRHRLHRLPFVELATDTTYQIQIAHNAMGKRVLVRRASAAQPIAELPADDNASLPLERLLLGAWRWQHLASLSATDATLQIGVQLLPVQASKESEGVAVGQVLRPPVPRRDVPAGRQVCLRRGDFFQMVFHNPSSEPRFVTVVELNPKGEIGVLFPDSERTDDSRIAPGTQLPPYQPYVFEVTNPPGKTLYLAVVTREPVDFRALIMQAGTASPAAGMTRAAARNASTSLGGLADLLVGSSAAQSPAPARSVVAVSGAWGIAQAWLDVPEGLQACLPSLR